MSINIDEVKRKEVKKKLSKYSGLAIIVIILLFVVICSFDSFYILSSGEEAVVTRFGKYHISETEAGVKFKMPLIDDVTVVNVSEVKRLEFGYETTGTNDTMLTYSNEIYSDMKMITSDECLVMVEASIQYKISDLYTYLFKTTNAEATFRIIAESALRRVIASHTLDESMTDNKSAIQLEIRDDLQELCNAYQVGITVSNVQLQDVNPPTEVEEAFRDVAGAREDKNTYINEANSYANEVIPNARGNAQQLINQAEAYKQERIATAEGEVASFTKVFEEYKNNTDIMRIRMYLEMIEEVLPGSKVYIMDEKSADLNTLLPLDSLTGTEDK